MSENKSVGRLALRVEGDNWTAYWAKPDTMDGAMWLASIRMVFVQDEARQEAFKSLLVEALAEVFADKLGTPVEAWDQRPAPESERSGSA